jgi:hypothetical protein
MQLQGGGVMEFVIEKFKKDFGKDGLVNVYSFEKIPQAHRYLKVGCLFCKTDRKAINQAKKILGDKNAKFVIKEVV